MATSAMCIISNFADFLVCPTLHYYNFYLVIFLGLIFLLAWRIHHNQKNDEGKGDLISAIGTSSLAFSILGLLGTLVKSNQDIPLIQSDILLILYAITIPFILLWIFRKI